MKFSDHVIKTDNRTFKGSTVPIVYLGMHEFKYLNTGKIIPEESFMNAYTEEIYESEHVCTATKLLCIILDAKYEKENLHKVMKTQCQHLTETQRNELLQ